MKKKLLFFSISMLIIAILLIDVFYNFSTLSDLILAITAIIVLWYTFETYEIRVANQEIVFKSQRPAINFSLFIHEKKLI